MCKKIISILVVLVFLAVLCFIDLRAFVNTTVLPVLSALKPNLDFLAQLLSDYGALLLAFFLIGFFFYILITFRPSLRVSEFSFAGITFQLRRPNIKKRVAMFLNTRRSIFYFLEEYDNLYDVMKSWYEILCFLRDLINEQATEATDATQTRNTRNKTGATSEDSENDAENAVRNAEVESVSSVSSVASTEEAKEPRSDMEACEGLFVELNSFLTKYQSDYRRYYQDKITTGVATPVAVGTDSHSSTGHSDKNSNKNSNDISYIRDISNSIDGSNSSDGSVNSSVKNSGNGSVSSVSSFNFIGFNTIQRSYPKYKAIVDDIKRINTVMQSEYGPYFGVHFRKWEAVIDRIVGRQGN